jgi:hypothetical protein
MPGTLESGQFAIDLGDQQMLELRLTFRDDASARKSVKFARRLLDLFRAELLGLVADELEEAEPGERPAYLDQVVPLGGELEKCLQKATPRTERSAIVVAVPMKVEAKRVRTGLVSVAQLLVGSRPGLFFAPASRDDLPMPTQLGEGREGVAVSPSRWGGSPVPPPPPPGGPLAATNPSPPPPSVSAVAKLTVANVRKEPVMLFTVDGQGELTFVKKLPAGEADDLKTTVGQRWVAVFTSEPYHVKFVVSQPEVIWLLR